jgi:signal transduction histidine kinase
VGLSADAVASPAAIDLVADKAAELNGWPVARVAQSGQPELVEDVVARFGQLPGGVWPEAPWAALVLPVAPPGHDQPEGIMVAAISPRRALDEEYQTFLELVAGQVATAVANARAYEEERKRAEALAELDRAKTTFFNNVSHEFRTPLTLMLGPLQDLLHQQDIQVPQAAHEELKIVHRNGLRLLKLVNTLLDFSRIEAGRIQAIYEPTDLAGFTAELAGVFRSAIGRAGLRLAVDCPPLALREAVYVDRDLWEKIVLNLLSNAFKFTFDGEIAVALRPAADGTAVELVVRDTGIGVPPEELPHLFERFHRIPNVRSRSHEGTGIGLALVQELVKLHGGRIQVESIVDQGTTFVASIRRARLTCLLTESAGRARRPRPPWAPPPTSKKRYAGCPTLQTWAMVRVSQGSSVRQWDHQVKR